MNRWFMVFGIWINKVEMLRIFEMNFVGSLYMELEKN